MKEAGLGDIYLNFLRLKEKLQKEGLFDEDKKLKVPESPEKNRRYHLADRRRSSGYSLDDQQALSFRHRLSLPVARPGRGSAAVVNRRLGTGEPRRHRRRDHHRSRRRQFRRFIMF